MVGVLMAIAAIAFVVLCWHVIGDDSGSLVFALSLIFVLAASVLLAFVGYTHGWRLWVS